MIHPHTPQPMKAFVANGPKSAETKTYVDELNKVRVRLSVHSSVATAV